MSIDEHGSRAAQRLRDELADDLSSTRMLESLQRTRTRRRMALASSAVVAAVAVAAVVTASPGHHAAGPVGPGPSAPTSSATAGPHANGALFGYGASRLLRPAGLQVPPLGAGSSPTWSPDGSHVAVLAGGILITDVQTGGTLTLPCAGCAEISWSPDGHTFAASTTGSQGPALELVDATTGDTTPVPLPGIDAVRSVTWAPDSQRLAFLAVVPIAQQGAWTVRIDGSRPRMFLHHETGLLDTTSEDANILAIRWSPTRANVAVLYATYAGDPRRAAPGGRFRLDLWTVDPDSTQQSHLLNNGDCACGGWAPNLAWSPDGRTLVLSSLHRRPGAERIDMDGRPIRVEFAKGASGPLTWQPLPPHS